MPLRGGWPAPGSGPSDDDGLDPVDRLALDEAADALATAPTGSPLDLVVVGDRTGALTLAAARRFGVTSVRAFTDGIDAERLGDKLASAAPPCVRIGRHGLAPALVAGATLIVARLPKHLAELEELTALAATHAADGVRFVGAGRVKHLTRGMNDVLARGFTDVRGSLGRQKSRALHAAGPRRDHAIAPFPRWAAVPELGIDVAAHGGAFAGASLDIGARALIDALPGALDAAGSAPDAGGLAVDLGCGTGLLAIAIARARPRMRVIATDRSWAACASARATIERAGLAHRVEVVRDDAAASLSTGAADLVACNPPFHDGHGIDDDAALPLVRAAVRILRPGAPLVTVFNAHLPHRTTLRRVVGPTWQLARTPKFVVTLSTVAERA